MVQEGKGRGLSSRRGREGVVVQEGKKGSEWCQGRGEEGGGRRRECAIAKEEEKERDTREVLVGGRPVVVVIIC